MNSVCPECKHVIFPTEPKPHVCPTPEYYRLRNSLFEDAMRAEELFTLDELEGEAEAHRYS